MSGFIDDGMTPPKRENMTMDIVVIDTATHIETRFHPKLASHATTPPNPKEGDPTKPVVTDATSIPSGHDLVEKELFNNVYKEDGRYQTPLKMRLLL